MNKLSLEPLHEILYEDVLPSGLKVLILPKKGFSRVNVSFQIAFGSIDLAAKLSSGEETVLPEGTAHFLEHMIFENTELDVSKSFSMIGSNVNAYTTFNRTVYYFSTTKEVLEPLNLLLNTILHPTFDDTHIEKEKSIIKSEIQMYQDDLEQSLYYDTMKKMYHQNPIRSDIAGTQKSILNITSDVLKKAYDIYYHLSNCLLVVSGDVSSEEIMTYLYNHEVSKIEKMNELEKRICKTESSVLKHHSFELKKDVVSSMVMVGIKLDLRLLSNKEKAIIELQFLLILDNFFGKSSPNYQKLIRRKLINNTFDYSVSVESTFFHILFYTESKRPVAIIDELRNMFSKMTVDLLGADRFENQKRKIIGQFIQIFNSPSEVAHLLLEYELKGLPLPLLMEEVDNLKISDLYPLLVHFKKESMIDFYYHS
ncbi:MAG: pitrilysin family protein [Candidatus Izemoplasmatales bacterium]|nr:pitrilysin family protein [Candidatus Izemoplasmatales bacterium]